MSNTRRPKWTAAQITAANAEAHLAELAAVVAVEDDPATRSLMVELWDRLDAAGRAEEFPAVADEIRASVAREAMMARLVADLRAAGCTDPGRIAELEQKAMELGTDYWAGIYRTLAGKAD